LDICRRLSCTILTLGFLVVCDVLYAYPPGWSDDILLTPEDHRSRFHPDVDVDDFNNVWVVWDTSTWWGGDVFFSKRDSLGGCLIPEVNVSNHPAICMMPRIAIDRSNNAQIIWRGASPSGGGVWHAKIANDGSFIVPSHISIDGYGACNYLPQMELNKYNEICIIWDEPAVRYPQMTFSKLDSLGNPLIERIATSLPGVYTIYPGIGIDSMANVHVGFRSDSGVPDRLTYTKLDKDGNILISNQFLGTGLLPTFIADRSQNIHVVYQDPPGTGRGSTIEYLKLDQNGNVLVAPLVLSLPAHENSSIPHMAMDSLQYLHVVWEAQIGTIFPVMYAKLDTLGNFVIPPMQVVYPPHTVRGGGAPRIAVDRSNRLHVVWVDDRLNPFVSTDIYYKRGENETAIQEAQSSIVEHYSMLSVSPNPFFTRAKIAFKLSYDTGDLKIEIFDVTGSIVKEFFPAESEWSTYWDGTDKLGTRLPGGVYFIRLSSQDEDQVTPIVLLR
jgi:hypothetical protein